MVTLKNGNYVTRTLLYKGCDCQRNATISEKFRTSHRSGAKFGTCRGGYRSKEML